MKETPLSNCERRFLLRAIEEKKVNWEFSAASAVGLQAARSLPALVGPGSPRRSRRCFPKPPVFMWLRWGLFKARVMPATVSTRAYKMLLTACQWDREDWTGPELLFSQNRFTPVNTGSDSRLRCQDRKHVLSTHGKGHEEGSLTYAKAGSSLRSPPGPHLARMGASQGFPRAAAPVGVFSRGTTRISGSLSCGVRPHGL